jgi:hypothetical protein
VRALLALAVVYVLAPGHPLALLPGIPLKPLGLSAVVAIGLLWFGFGDRRIHGRKRVATGLSAVLGLLLFAKLGCWSLAPDYGLPGWYFANGRFQGAPERSSEFPRASYTRRDGELSFGGDEFPVYFLNDFERFNFFGPQADRRRNLPFSARWQGSVFASNEGTYRFWLTASGPAELSLDGRQIAAVDADGRETRMAEARLAEGPHDIRVTYARRPPRSADLKVDWDGAGERQPLAVPFVSAEARSLPEWRRDQAVLQAAIGNDIVFMVVVGGIGVWLVGSRIREIARARSGRWPLIERPLLALFLAAAYLHAAVPELDRVDKMALLGGGQDWLTHETLARDILLNGPLMTLGKPLGEGRTYYAQPFYPYALAFMHWFAGEDQFGPTVLQLFGLGVAGVLLYFIAVRLFDRWSAVATLAIFVAIREWQLDWVARRLLSENVYVVLIPAGMLLMLRHLDERRRSDLVLAGSMLGLAIVTRGPTLLYLPLAGFLVALTLRIDGADRRTAGRAAGVLMAVSLAVAVLVPLRNWIVAREPAFVATSGGVNLEKFHRPTSVVRLGEANRRWYAPYVRDVPTREVLEFIQQDPVGYAATYGPLILYTLGYGAALEESHIVVWPDLIALNLLYVAAIVFSARARTPRAALLHAFIAVHFATMVVFVPYDYDNRLVLPMYLPMTVFAGFALVGGARWFVTRLTSAGSPAGILLPESAPRGEAGSAAIIRRP